MWHPGKKQKKISDSYSASVMPHEVKLVAVAVASREGLLVFNLSRVIDLDMKSSCGSTAASCFPVFGQHCDLTQLSVTQGFSCCSSVNNGTSRGTTCCF